MIRFAKWRAGEGLLPLSKRRVLVVKSGISASWTVNVLIVIREHGPQMTFVKVIRDNERCLRVHSIQFIQGPMKSLFGIGLGQDVYSRGDNP